ncbi:endonuclease/exonuclease/phosphatase family protein [Profundibacterium mesophilum]|uniref:PTS system maltose and glucose-specific IIB component n=1 Tax=Profundibacterium mesophilum KAUST100406-0324 TaxID=1037889 RepID=A0A921NUW8_9RHOB|nr:endonuclease/exonuclease/phosphatase family protein [Profundibacterium mesophilum]KAF0677119.1 PTS system maltose and glucose-specific IIB component [Profundibacterium mesophilum KAUST100406-0324]
MTEHSLRIVTYNIRKAMGTDRRRDPRRIMRVLAALRADVVLLQEADRRRAPRPPALPPAELGAATGLHPVTFDHGRDSLGWHGNAVLVREGIELVARDFFDLPGLEPRGGISVDLALKGVRFKAIGVHLGLLRGARRVQISALRDMLAAGPSLPTVIGGDFNERSLRVGLGRFSPAFRILDGGATYHARRPLFALDRIALSPEFEVHGLHAATGPELPFASDHLPLVAELSLKGSPGG